MSFNKYLWKLYSESSEGKTAIPRNIHTTYAEFTESDPDTYFFACYELDQQGEISGKDPEFEEFSVSELVSFALQDEKIDSIEKAEKLFIDIIDEGLSITLEQNDGKEFESKWGGGLHDEGWYVDILNSISGFTLGLYEAFPEYFVPYFFARRFDEFKRICAAFNIHLDEVPGKINKRERLLYYLKVNRALYHFRSEYGLSPDELLAFLYDFGPKNTEIKPLTTMPAPSRVWFVIGGVGGNGDFNALDEVDDTSVYHWQGNLEMRPGDVVLMWCASPRSYIHSIWRAMSEGYNDPFFTFYATVKLGKPIVVPPVKFSEISKDPILSQKPTVKGKFQGASGSTFTIEEYAAVLKLIKSKGHDINKLPHPPYSKVISNFKIDNERDVEIHLLEPLLRHLGFTNKDWVRQFSIRMGRGERNYPDYVLGAEIDPGNERGAAIIECKYDIDKSSDLKEAFLQANSYALRLRSSILALAAIRGIWVFEKRNDGFSHQHFTFRTWDELSNPDVLHELSLKIGVRAVNNYRSNRKTG